MPVRLLSKLRPRRCAVGTLHPVALVVSALHAIMTKPPFEIARHFLVLAVVVAVAHGAHLLELDAPPTLSPER
jgi:hypothetical protein